MTHEADAMNIAVDQLARESYGRLLAYFSMRWRDVAAAEDALSEAFVAALESWPRTGVPSKPEAWLLTVARRKLTDAARRDQIRNRQELLARLETDGVWLEDFDEGMPDERLRLMLVCAHPAIDVSIRSALMLQTVLGVEVRQMAGAFLLSTEALTKRLVRAKAKIKAAGLRFEEPAPQDLAPRLHAVLEAIYAAYFIGREGALSDGDRSEQLGSEAIYLARVVARSLPEDAEAVGFLALLMFCEARRSAQTSIAGEFVPLLEQNPRDWDEKLMRIGYELLGKAAALGSRGPFQLEAAIQAAHCYRARSGKVPWREIVNLYEALVREYPMIGAMVGLGVATAYAEDNPAKGIDVLQRINPELVRGYQPYWAAIGHLYTAAGDRCRAKQCLERALGLTSHLRLYRYLHRRLADLESGPYSGNE